MTTRVLHNYSICCLSSLSTSLWTLNDSLRSSSWLSGSCSSESPDSCNLSRLQSIPNLAEKYKIWKKCNLYFKRRCYLGKFTLLYKYGSHQNEEFFVFAFFATRRKIDFFIFFLPAKNWKKLLRLMEFWWLHTWTLKHSQVTRIKREIKATHLSNKIGCRHCPSN